MSGGTTTSLAHAVQTAPAWMNCLGYQQLTSISSATPLTVPQNTKLIVLIAQTQVVMYRDDGTAPTASIGMNLAVGVPFFYPFTTTNLQFIQSTSGAILNASFYG